MGIINVRFSENFMLFVFLLRLFWDSPFCFTEELCVHWTSTFLNFWLRLICYYCRLLLILISFCFRYKIKIQQNIFDLKLSSDTNSFFEFWKTQYFRTVVLYLFCNFLSILDSKYHQDWSTRKIIQGIVI